MKILALDTSTQACSCALYLDGQIIESYQLAPRQQSNLILPMIEDLLAQSKLTLNQCDALAFGCGPGSFTGIRIASAITQGLAFAANLPVIPVSTLLALAQGAYREFGAKKVMSLLAATKQEVYQGSYVLNDVGIMGEMVEERCMKVEEVEISMECGVGDGWDLVETNGSTNIYPDFNCHAQDIALLAADKYKRGEWVAAKDALPVYLLQPEYVRG